MTGAAMDGAGVGAAESGTSTHAGSSSPPTMNSDGASDGGTVLKAPPGVGGTDGNSEARDGAGVGGTGSSFTLQ